MAADKPRRRFSVRNSFRRSFTPMSNIPEDSPAQTPTPPAPVHRPTPGPNAFAQQAARVDKHRLESNAFYQQEMQRRAATPPTAIHPAFREDFDFNAPVERDSNSHYTTMSPLGQTPPTPPILLPKDCFQAHPTDRGFIEDKREQLQHKNSGSDTERTPVFIPTPNIESSEFSRSNSYTTPKKKVSIQDNATVTDQTKTPKKSFLEKLGFATPRSSTSSVSSLSTNRGYAVHGGETLPPKAKAVLSNSPHKTGLARAPSKTKGFFSSKGSERPSLETHKSSPAYTSSEPRSAGAQTVSFSDSTCKTPQTAHTSSSDPIYDRHSRHMQAQRAFPPADSDKVGRKMHHQNKDGSACGVSRTRSLQYFDHTMPPTPPAKNTPPHEKEARAQREVRLGKESRAILEHNRWVAEQHRLEIMRNTSQKKEMVQTPESKMKSPILQGMFDDGTPTDESAKLIGTDGRISPTKSGGYGRKEMPKLVKQPSVYSMHASFYPDLHDQYSFEEVKRCTDGLGLEGLSELPESFYNSDPKFSYSPSAYSEDFAPRPSGLQSSPSMLHQMDIAQHSPSLLADYENRRPMPAKGMLTEKPSASSQGTIPMVYPDLASDPSRSDLRDALQEYHGSTSKIEFSAHTRKQSPSRSLSLTYSQSPSQNQSPSHRRSPQKPALEVMVKALGEGNIPLSPPSYSCPSAKPSPLHFLPNSVYSPQRNLTLNVDVAPESPSSTSTRTLTPSRSRGRIETFKSATGSPIARMSSTSPFENLPTLSPSIKPTFDALPTTAESNEQPEPEPQKQKSRNPSPTFNNPVRVEDESDHEDKPQQAPETRDQALKRTLQEQMAEVARLKAEAQEFKDRISGFQEQIRNLDTAFKPVTGIPERVRHLVPQYMQDRGYVAESDVGRASGTAGVGASKKTEEREHAKESEHTKESKVTNSEMIAPPVEEGSLAQIGLYHRVQQQRVDQEYDDTQIADLERHDQSDNNRNASQDGPSPQASAEVTRLCRMLADVVKDIQAGRL
ncbi:hypothetical protein Q7P35_010709 [Cladosporium inversicolor]